MVFAHPSPKACHTYNPLVRKEVIRWRFLPQKYNLLTLNTAHMVTFGASFFFQKCSLDNRNSNLVFVMAINETGRRNKLLRTARNLSFKLVVLSVPLHLFHWIVLTFLTFTILTYFMNKQYNCTIRAIKRVLYETSLNTRLTVLISLCWACVLQSVK